MTQENEMSVYTQHAIYTDEAKAIEAASFVEVDADDGQTIHIVPDAAGAKFIVEVRVDGAHFIYV